MIISRPLCLLALFVITSCTTHQYVYLESDLPQKSEGQQYYYDSEEVYVAYDFNGPNMPVFLYIENTGERDIYLDLVRSMFLENNQFVRDLMVKKSTRTVVYDADNYYAGVAYGSRLRHNEVMMIPPGKILKLRYRPFSVAFERDRKRSVPRDVIQLPGGTRVRAGISEYQSPRNFEIRLVFGLDREFEDEWVVDSHFKQSRTIFTDASPTSFVGGTQANVYHTEETRGGGVGAVFLGGIGVGLLIMLADDPEEY